MLRSDFVDGKIVRLLGTLKGTLHGGVSNLLNLIPPPQGHGTLY